jgi:hypothetical protein
MNLKVPSRSYDLTDLRFWPLFGEGLRMVYFHDIEVSAYYLTSKFTFNQTADFIVKLWQKLDIQDFEGYGLNVAFL